MDEMRNNCPLRHKNGNCLPMCGLCKAVNDAICAAVRNAYRKGKHDTIMAIMDAVEKQEKDDG